MTSEIRSWLEKEYANAGIENLQIDTVIGAIKDALAEIKSEELFDKRINVSKNISVLLYKSGTVEVHISIEGVLSTYETFKPTPKTFIVPFQAEETVWNNCIAKVKALSAEEAFEKVRDSICYSNPFRDFDADWDGVNTVTNEVIETSRYGIGEEFGCDIEDVEYEDERPSCTLQLSAFDIARYGKDALYHQAENAFLEVGLELEIFEMEMIPEKIEEHFVAYKCIPTDFTKTFTNGDIWHIRDGKKL